MAGKNEIVITADASQLLKENAKIQAANEKLEKKYESLKKKSSAAAREEIQRGREIEAALKKAMSPAERYNATLKQYKKDLDAGRISQEQFNKLRDMELKKLNATKVALDKTSNAVEKNTREVQRNVSATTKSNSTFTNLASSVASYATGILSATAILKAFTAELEKNEKLRQRARDASVTAEEGLQQARANFVPDQTVSKQNLDQQLQRAATASGVPLGEFAAAAADAFSSRGDRSNRFAIAATQAAFAASPNKDVTSARELAQSAGDFAKLGGSQSPEAIVGFLTQAQQSARITDVAKLGESAFPAVSAAVQGGSSIQQGMQQFIALNNLVGDAEGRVSSTASIQLTEQLNAFEPLAGVAGTSAKLAALQQNPQLAAQFMESASFEKKALAGVRSLVTNDARGQAAVGDAAAKIGSLDALQDPQNIAAFQAYASFVQGQGTLGGELKGAGRAAELNLQNQRLQASERSITQQINDTLTQTLDNINLPGLDLPKTFVTSRRAQANQTPEQAIAFARSNLESLVNENQTFRPLGGRLSDDADIQLVRSQLDVLTRIEQQLAKTREEQRRQADEAQNAARNANRQNPIEQLGGRK